jgi:sec-independent protein translocase protein TatB
MFPFDLDFSKIILFGIVAIAVIPPKDLPRVMRTVGQTIAKMRRMAREFQNTFMDAIKEADLESVKQEISALGESAKVDVNFDPVADVKQALEPALQAGEDVKPADAGVIATPPHPAEAPPAAEAGAQATAAPIEEAAK